MMEQHPKEMRQSPRKPEGLGRLGHIITYHKPLLFGWQVPTTQRSSNFTVQFGRHLDRYKNHSYSDSNAGSFMLVEALKK